MQNDIEMSEVWKVEQEILDVFHDFCKKNKIRYSLGYGTLLGAIRHDGFIPWDDDIDVIMPRQDYDRFIRLWRKKPVEGYILQDEYSNIEDYANNFSKLRKDSTSFIQSEAEMKRKYHKGIFIDLFPVDRVAPKGISRKMQYAAFAVYMLYTREFTDGSKGVKGFIQNCLLGLPKKSHKVLMRNSFNYMTRWNKSKNELVSPCTAALCKMYYPADLFDHLELHTFNGRKYYITSEYDEFLTSRYGDYMKLPPEKDRVWKHRPVYISTEHNFEDRDK